MAIDNVARGLATQALAQAGGGTVTLTGDVTGSGSGSFAATIGANKVTYGKFQQVAAVSLVGNPTGALANSQGITLDPTLAFSGTTLAVASAGHPGFVSGNWYIPTPYATVSTGAAIPANNIKLLPFTVTKPITVSALAARLTTASSGGNFQLAIYANNPTTGRPTGTALCSTASISTTTTGALSAAVGANTLLNPGTYWMAINQDNAVAIYETLAGTVVLMGALIGSATLANVTSSGTAAAFGLSVSQTFGTWPDLTSASFTEQTTQANALLFLKAA